MSPSFQLLAAAGDPAPLWPFAVLGICLATIVLLVSVVRMHAFFALVLAAILAGVLAEKLPAAHGAGAGGPSPGHWAQAAELTAEGFGNVAGKIGVAIALASVIGTCLVESGAADKVVRRFLALFGERRAGPALFASSYLLSIPIFFDTFFMLMLPIARSLALRTRRDYMLFVLAICCGGTVTHSLVAPHPGPLAMAENLHLDLGQTIAAGIVAGVLPALCAWMVAGRISRRLNVPMRETDSLRLEDAEPPRARRDEELPSLAWSLAPVLLPVLLIGSVSFLDIFGARARFSAVFPLLEFVGHRNVALLLGAAIGVALLMRQRKFSLAQVTERISPPFATAGVVILISSAGGAFGFMLRHAGVGEAIQALTAGRGVNLILLAWTVSAIIRIAQGSATVAMITTSSMIYPMMNPATLPYHPIYIFLAIGFGSKMLSWMNDSGFWVVSKLSGFTESETLRSWTVIVTVASISGLLVTLLGAAVLPGK